MKNDYVLNHDFGYGKLDECETLNKLYLRNFNDLKIYVNGIIKSMFVANVKDNVICFLDDNSKIKVVMERLL